MFNGSRVRMETHYLVEQFLYKEARLLDNEMLREWLETMLDPNIRYRMVIKEDRFRKDKSRNKKSEISAYDDNYAALELRVKQFESGLQTMLDPVQRMRRLITNIEVFSAENEAEYHVLSYGAAFRHRRLYEREQLVFSREDIIRQEEDSFRIVSRRIDLGDRVIQNKNLLFFL